MSSVRIMKEENMMGIIEKNEKIAETVTTGFQKMSDGVADGFNKMSEGVVKGYKKSRMLSSASCLPKRARRLRRPRCG